MLSQNEKHLKAIELQKNSFKYGELYCSNDAKLICMCVICEDLFYETEEFFDHLNNQHINKRIVCDTPPTTNDELTPPQQELPSAGQTAVVVGDIMTSTEMKKTLKLLKHEPEEFLPINKEDEMCNFAQDNSMESSLNSSNEQIVTECHTISDEENDEEFDDIGTLINIESDQELNEFTAQSCTESPSEVNPSIARKRPRRPFGCLICGKRMSSEESLNKHYIQLHSTERDTQMVNCDICRKQVLRRNYQLHKRIHLGRQYDCQYCGAGYKHRTTLKKHINFAHTAREPNMPASNTMEVIPGSIAAAVASDEQDARMIRSQMQAAMEPLRPMHLLSQYTQAYDPRITHQHINWQPQQSHNYIRSHDGQVYVPERTRVLSAKDHQPSQEYSQINSGLLQQQQQHQQNYIDPYATMNYSIQLPYNINYTPM